MIHPYAKCMPAAEILYERVKNNMKKIDRDAKIVIGVIFLITALVGIFSVRSAVKSRFAVEEHLQDTVIDVDGQPITLKDMAFWILDTETSVQEQALQYDFDEPEKYWRARVNSRFVNQMVKDGIVDTVIHDEVFYRMAIRDGVSLTDEEMSTVEEKAELYYQELTDPQKATLQISEEDIRAAMEKIGTAEKYAELFCIEKQCEYEDAAVSGNAYEEELNWHDYKLHHDVWNRVKVGTLTIPDNRL